MPFLRLPDGKFMPFPEGVSYDDALKKAQETYPKSFAKPELAEEGLIPSVKSGIEGLKSRLSTFAAPIFGQSDESARKAFERSQAARSEIAKAPSWEDVVKGQQEFGFFGGPKEDQRGGLGQFARFIRGQVGESLPDMGLTMVGARAGAGLGSLAGPVGTVAGGIAGGVLGALPSFVGGNVERQMEEQEKSGVQAPLDRKAALYAGVGQSALNMFDTVFVLGRLGVGKALGNALLKVPAQNAEQLLAKAAEASLLKASAKGALKGAMEVPTEIAQTILERKQAGLDLLSPDALKEYEATAAGAAGMGVAFGTVGGVHGRGVARDQLQELREARGAAEAEQRAAAEAQAKQAAEARAAAEAQQAEAQKAAFQQAMAEQRAPYDMGMKGPLEPGAAEQGQLFQAETPAGPAAVTQDEAAADAEDRARTAFDRYQTLTRLANMYADRMQKAPDISTYNAIQAKYAEVERQRQAVEAEAKQFGISVRGKEVSDIAVVGEQKALGKKIKALQTRIDKLKERGEHVPPALVQTLANLKQQMPTFTPDMFTPAAEQDRIDRNAAEMQGRYLSPEQAQAQDTQDTTSQAYLEQTGLPGMEPGQIEINKRQREAAEGFERSVANAAVPGGISGRGPLAWGEDKSQPPYLKNPELVRRGLQALANQEEALQAQLEGGTREDGSQAIGLKQVLATQEKNGNASAADAVRKEIAALEEKLQRVQKLRRSIKEKYPVGGEESANIAAILNPRPPTGETVASSAAKDEAAAQAKRREKALFDLGEIIDSLRTGEFTGHRTDTLTKMAYKHIADITDATLAEADALRAQNELGKADMVAQINAAEQLRSRLEQLVREAPQRQIPKTDMAKRILKAGDASFTQAFADVAKGRGTTAEKLHAQISKNPSLAEEVKKQMASKMRGVQKIVSAAATQDAYKHGMTRAEGIETQALNDWFRENVTGEKQSSDGKRTAASTELGELRRMTEALRDKLATPKTGEKRTVPGPRTESLEERNEQYYAKKREEQANKAQAEAERQIDEAQKEQEHRVKQAAEKAARLEAKKTDTGKARTLEDVRAETANTVAALEKAEAGLREQYTMSMYSKAWALATKIADAFRTGKNMSLFEQFKHAHNEYKKAAAALAKHEAKVAKLKSEEAPVREMRKNTLGVQRFALSQLRSKGVLDWYAKEHESLDKNKLLLDTDANVDNVRTVLEEISKNAELLAEFNEELRVYAVGEVARNMLSGNRTVKFSATALNDKDKAEPVEYTLGAVRPAGTSVETWEGSQKAQREALYRRLRADPYEVLKIEGGRELVNKRLGYYKQATDAATRELPSEKNAAALAKEGDALTAKKAEAAALATIAQNELFESIPSEGRALLEHEIAAYKKAWAYATRKGGGAKEALLENAPMGVHVSVTNTMYESLNSQEFLRNLNEVKAARARLEKLQEEIAAFERATARLESGPQYNPYKVEMQMAQARAAAQQARLEEAKRRAVDLSQAHENLAMDAAVMLSEKYGRGVTVVVNQKTGKTETFPLRTVRRTVNVEQQSSKDLKQVRSDQDALANAIASVKKNAKDVGLPDGEAFNAEATPKSRDKQKLSRWRAALAKFNEFSNRLKSYGGILNDPHFVSIAVKREEVRKKLHEVAKKLGVSSGNALNRSLYIHPYKDAVVDLQKQIADALAKRTTSKGEKALAAIDSKVKEMQKKLAFEGQYHDPARAKLLQERVNLLDEYDALTDAMLLPVAELTETPQYSTITETVEQQATAESRSAGVEDNTERKQLAAERNLPQMYAQALHMLEAAKERNAFLDTASEALPSLREEAKRTADVAAELVRQLEVMQAKKKVPAETLRALQETTRQALLEREEAKKQLSLAMTHLNEVRRAAANDKTVFALREKRDAFKDEHPDDKEGIQKLNKEVKAAETRVRAVSVGQRRLHLKHFENEVKRIQKLADTYGVSLEGITAESARATAAAQVAAVRSGLAAERRGGARESLAKNVAWGKEQATYGVSPRAKAGQTLTPEQARAEAQAATDAETAAETGQKVVVGGRRLKVRGVSETRDFDEDPDVRAAEEALGERQRTRKGLGVDFRLGTAADTGIDTTEAAKVHARIAKNLPPHINLVYVDSLANAPQELQDAAAEAGYEHVKGAVLPDGTVVVIGDAHASVADLESTFAHELIGHYGVDGILGPDGMGDVSGELWAKGEQHVAEVATALGAFPDMASALAAARMAQSDEARLTYTSEMIARAAEGRKVSPTFADKVKQFIKSIIAAVRNWFRQRGMSESVKKDTKEIQAIIREAYAEYGNTQAGMHISSTGQVQFSASRAAPLPAGISADLGEKINRMVAGERKIADNLKANLMGLAAEVQFVDHNAALNAMAKAGAKSNLITEKNAMQLRYNLSQKDKVQNWARGVAANGAPSLVSENGEHIIKGQTDPNAATLLKAFRALAKTGWSDTQLGRYATMYLAAKRVLNSNGKITAEQLNFSKDAMTEADLKRFVAEVDAQPKVKAALEEFRRIYNEYNKGLINFLVQTEAISAEQAALYAKDNDYIPFYRQGQGGDVELVVGGETAPLVVGNIKEQPHLQELVGGDTAILDIFTTSLQNTNMLVNKGITNLAARETAHTLRKLGVLKPNTVKKEERDAAAARGEEPKKSYQRPGEGATGPNIIRFHAYGPPDKDGKREHQLWAVEVQTKGTAFEDIPEELVMHGIEGVKTTFPAALELAGLPAKVLRRAVILSPLYPIRQIIKDSLSGWGTSGADFIPIVTPFKNVAKALSGTDKTYKELEQLGLVGGQILTGSDRESMAVILRNIAGNKGSLTGLLGWLESKSMMADAGMRAAAYNSFKKKGMSELETYIAVNEMMDFNKRGASPSIYVMNTLVPFFNAQIQSLNVLAKVIRGNATMEEKAKLKEKFFKRGMMMAGMTLLYAAAMSDDEAYKNATPQQRLSNWFIRTPFADEPVRIPIPFEFGLLFKAIPEAMFNVAMGREEFVPVMKALGGMLFNSVPSITPQAIKTPFEMMSGVDMFTWENIESTKEKRLRPEERYRENTTELAKLLGSIGIPGLSPVKIDHFIKSVGAQTGLAIASLGDVLLGDSNKPPSASMKESKMPLIGGLFQPEDAGGIVNAVYDKMAQAEQYANTYAKLAAEDPAKADRYFESHFKDITLAKAAPNFREEMKKLAAEEQFIRTSRDMLPREKRLQLDQLRQHKIEVARNYRDVIREMR